MTGSIAAISYTSATLAFLVMAGLLLARWRGRRFSRTLLIACLVSALWAGAVMLRLFAGPALYIPLDLLELARSASWSWFLLTLAAPPADSDGRSDKSPLARLVLGLYVVLAAATIYAALHAGFAQSANGGLLLLVGRVLAAIIGMLLVEKLFMKSASDDRWSIKFACIGIGGLFAYDFYMYSDALLFRKLNLEVWAARGLVNALIVPLLAVSIARNPQWSLRLAVSRQLLFHSATISGSALYLLLMAGAAYYMRYFGGAWGPIVGAAFLFAAVIALAVTLFSGAFRAWLKIFISKHFYHYNYDYREEWLRFTRTLSEPGPGLEQRAVRALANLVESPAGIMFVRESATTFAPVAGWNIPSGDARQPIDSPFIRLLQEKHWVIDLSDFAGHPDGVEPVVLPEWLAATPNAWLVVPLILQTELVGFIVLTESRTKVRLNWEVLDLLKVAGSQAAGNLAQKHAADALMVARQFESYNRMSTFVVHDLKNLVSQLSLLVANAERHRDSAEFQQDMRDTVSHSVERMKILLQKFSRGAITERTSTISVEQVVRQAIAAKSAGAPQPGFRILERGLVVDANPARLERVIGHLIQNAMEATPRDGSIHITLSRAGQRMLLELSDTGAGMNEDFIRDRLFRPFESTKAAGMGIGVFESREYIQELGGSLDVSSTQGLGTTFRLQLPLHREPDDDEQSDGNAAYRALKAPA